MPAANENLITNFAYAAQTFEGRPVTGSIDAANAEAASKQLSAMQLRVLHLEPAQRAVRATPLGREDFAAFNQQLAHLSAAGLPIEQGLRLIADDLRNGGLAQSIRNVSAELERGIPLGEAFKRHEKQFPPLYGTLIDAGVRTGNLPAVLLNLGRHLELIAHLRAAIWSASAYPLAVLGGLLLVLIFLGHVVLPQFEDMYRQWYLALPSITQFLFVIAKATPIFIGIAITLFIGLPVLWTVLRAMRLDRAATDLVLWIPLVGTILRQNLIARWCDAMKLTILSGMDLPAAVQLTSDIVGSPALRRDGAQIAAQIGGGKAIDQIRGRLSIIPPTALAVMQLSSDRNDLPASLETMSVMYQQQAEMHLTSLQNILMPALLLVVAALIATVILGVFAPIVSLFRFLG